MQKSHKLFLALGCLFVLLGVTMPLQPQTVRRKNLPVTAEPPATTRKPDEVRADPPAPADTRKPTGEVTAEPRARTKVPTDEVTAEPRARTRRHGDDMIERPAEPETHVFEKPRYMNDRLDWCLRPGYQCGELAARTFCHRRRYEDVKAFEAEVVGRTEQTRLMGTDEVCNADYCTSFSYITCSGPIWRDRVFANPNWNEQRLDVCLFPGGLCGGRQAADRFCGSKGFMDALDFAVDQAAGRNKTRYIGTNALCDGGGCRGFQQIICRDPKNP